MAGRPRKEVAEDEVLDAAEVVEKICWGNIIYNAVTGEQIGFIEEPNAEPAPTEVVDGSPNEVLDPENSAAV